MHHLHATTTTTGSGLDHYRVADLAGHLEGALVVVRQRTVRAGHGGYAGLLHGFNGGYLVAHQADGFRSWSDKAKAAFLDLLSKVGVFSQEAVTRVNAYGVRYFCSADDGRDVQVAFRRAVGTDADGFVGETNVHKVAIDL